MCDQSMTVLDLTGGEADGWIAPLATGYEAKPAAQERFDTVNMIPEHETPEQIRRFATEVMAMARTALMATT